MSLCVMSDKSVRRLNCEYGLDIVHAAAHHDGHSVFVTISDGRCYWLDRQAGTIERSQHGGTWSIKNFGRAR